MSDNKPILTYNRTELALLDILKDGARHPRVELVKVLKDPASGVDSLKVHLCWLRKKLRKLGQDIIPELGANKSIHYRQVILLKPPTDDIEVHT